MKKSICFILDSYPTENSNGCVFAKHLICAVADMGYECSVIAPRVFGVSDKVPYKRVEYTEKGAAVRVFVPSYLHLSSRRQTIRLSMNNHFKSVMSVIKREKLEPMLVYGHFIYQCGLTAARVGKKLGIPSYCACGENSLRLVEGSKPYETGLLHGRWKEILKGLSGIVSVSSSNEKLLRDGGFIDESMPVGVFPNGVDPRIFHTADKKLCRKELGFPEAAFIVAYTGTFSANKGADRLSEALRECDNIYSVFMGQGSIVPDCDRILHKGKVPNSDVAKYLNAADIFVLPTRGEGCCNAIVEALSCGLPVISSDLPFNDDILNNDNSLRIDVEDVSAIRDSIMRLYEDAELRTRLSEGAIKSAKRMSINVRAERILKFMEF